MRSGDEPPNLDQHLPLTSPVLLKQPLLTNFNGTLIEKVLEGNYDKDTKLQKLKNALISNNRSLTVTQNSGPVPELQTHINVPLPPSWHTVDSKDLTMLVTFGHNNGGVHIEEECAAGWAQLVEGKKKWQIWPPGEQPSPSTQPQFVFTQNDGEVVLMPSGWWHAVETVSNGAVLVGATWWSESLSANTSQCAT